MQNPTQYINAGSLKYDEAKHKALGRYKTAVERAGFLNAKEKDHWQLLGSLLSSEQLKEAEQLIISEDLRQLQTRQALERIKPNAEKRNG